MIKKINLTAQQTDASNDVLIQQFAMQAKIINVYIIIYILLLIFIQWYQIYYTIEDNLPFIIWIVFMIFLGWAKILIYILIYILSWLIIRNKNTVQYAMCTNTILNVIYHILYIAIIISIFSSLKQNTTDKYDIDEALSIFQTPLIIKLILDIIVYYVYKDDYNEIKTKEKANQYAKIILNTIQSNNNVN